MAEICEWCDEPITGKPVDVSFWPYETEPRWMHEDCASEAGEAASEQAYERFHQG